jgi:Small primase-like proteins (Toprim domain)
MERIKISRPVLVEGKYDKIKLESVIDACIITTDGFNVFKNDEKLALIKKLAEREGIIVITDSDGAGLVIRNYINSALPKDKIIHLYIPEIFGKEKRKTVPSKSGLIGVEGIDCVKLREIFKPFENGNVYIKTQPITKRDFYEHGLSGGDNSSANRKKVTDKLGFPSNMSANALLDAINMLYTYDEFINLIEDITK